MQALNRLWQEFLFHGKIKKANIVKKIKACGKKFWGGAKDSREHNNIVYRKLYFSFRNGSRRSNFEGIRDCLPRYRRRQCKGLKKKDVNLVLDVLKELWQKSEYQKALEYNNRVARMKRNGYIYLESSNNDSSDKDEHADEEMTDSETVYEDKDEDEDVEMTNSETDSVGSDFNDNGGFYGNSSPQFFQPWIKFDSILDKMEIDQGNNTLSIYGLDHFMDEITQMQVSPYDKIPNICDFAKALKT
jgi:hypothetical protein